MWVAFSRAKVNVGPEAMLSYAQGPLGVLNEPAVWDTVWFQVALYLHSDINF